MKQTSKFLTLVVAAACAIAPRSALAAAHTTVIVTDDADKKSRQEGPLLSDEYRLGRGDKLRIEVYKDAQLSQSVQIRPDGKITVPLVGDVEAAGRTPIELRDALTTALKQYMTNPVVTVIVVEATAATAYVLGEVNHPGAVNLQAPLTILQALAVAGGLKDFADAKNIRILRTTPTGVQTIAFDYKEALKTSRAPVYLRPGDTVVVPD
jgi:polysaccharide export outer membrane protein